MLWQSKTVSTNTNERYDEVLSVAAHLIARDGFERASIRAIAQESNLSQAGLYHYFDSKEDLLFQLQKHTFAALRNSLAARLDPNMLPTERFKTLICNHLEFFTDHMDKLRVCAFEHNKLTGKYYDEVLVIRRDYFRIAHNIVKEVLASGKTGSAHLDSKRVTLYLFGILNWIHMWFDTKRRTSKETVADEITNMILFGIAPKEKKR